MSRNAHLKLVSRCITQDRSQFSLESRQMIRDDGRAGKESLKPQEISDNNDAVFVDG